MNPVPIWVWLAGGALGAAVAFGAGWQVRGWKCDAALVKTYEAAIKKGRAQQAAVAAQATTYEQEKADAVVQTNTVERELRTIYRDVKVPVQCAAPDTAVSVLEQAVDSANARAGGEPAPAVPGPAETAAPPDRP